MQDWVYALQHGMRLSGSTTYTTPSFAAGQLRHGGLINIPTHNLGAFPPGSAELAIVCDTDGSPDA